MTQMKMMKMTEQQIASLNHVAADGYEARKAALDAVLLEHNETGRASIRFELDDELERKFEEWRRRQPQIPSRAAAARYFVKRALEDGAIWSGKRYDRLK